MVREGCVVFLGALLGCAPAPATKAAPAPSPTPSAAVVVDAGWAEHIADAAATAPAVIDAGVPSPCTRTIVTGRVKDVDVRVCVEEVGPIEGREAAVFPRLEDVPKDGRNPRLLESSLMPMRAKTAKPTNAWFRDVTGDGIEDVLVEAPSWDQPHCRYVIDGAAVYATATKNEPLSEASKGLSFAAALSRDPKDPWASVARATHMIAQAEACAILKSLKGTVASFEKIAAPDAEIVAYGEPSHPYCLRRIAGRGLTKERLAKIEEPSCSSLTCATDAPLCRNHEPDPSTDYYFFQKEKSGFRLRAIATYGAP